MSLLNLFSATYNLPEARYFRAQIVWISIGMVIMLVTTIFDYRILERISYAIYGIVLLLLAYVMIAGRSALGAQRWVQIGPISIQPSELAKIAIVFVLARYFSRRRDPDPISFAGLFWPAMLTGIPCLLILKQPDLGTAIIVAAVAATLIIFVGLKKRVIATLVIIAAISAPLAWKFVLRPYQKERIFTFLNPERNPLDQGYQIIQAKIAIGSGELTGKGYLSGTQSKLQFLPKQHTDFVFSNYAEEFGFLGTAVLLGLYAVFAFLGLNAAYSAKDRFGALLGLGITAMVISQAIINLGMEMGLLPVVGVTLPLFSYGGTSLLTTLAAIGVLLNISMRRYMF